MTPIYIPILKAKPGEFEALRELSYSVSKQCCPLFEVPLPRDQQNNKKKSPTPKRDRLDKAIKGIAEARKGRDVAIDISEWPPNANVETGEHVLGYLVKGLIKAGVLTYPIIGFDRWDDLDYQAAIAAIQLEENASFIVRFDRTSIDDMKDTDFLKDQLASIAETCGSGSESLGVILDFGDLCSIPVADLQEQAADALTRLVPWDFKFKILIGASFPATINDAVAEIDSEANVLRREIVAWKALRKTIAGASLLFGDYGVRNPKSHDGIATHANGKIRYTAGHNYFVARGHSLKLGNKYGQFVNLAAIVAGSAHFRNADFSWGDAQIDACRSGQPILGPTRWVAIDTNHHITAVVEDLFVFTQNIEYTYILRG